jgi:hypothetical protein
MLLHTLLDDREHDAGANAPATTRSAMTGDE